MKTQSGRSMIEMLGVLAIIGVLSIGGLAGYTRAMSAYQANQIMDYMNHCSVALQEKLALSNTSDVTAGTTTCDDDAVLGSTSYTAPVAVTITTLSDSQIVLTGASVDDGVCNNINAKGGSWACTSNVPTATYTL